jgi:hypothetical protein
MKQSVLSAVIAAIVSLGLYFWFSEPLSRQTTAPPQEATEPPGRTGDSGLPVFNVTDALIEDTWVNAARGAGSDLRTLTDASHSICYLTKIEISGVEGSDDTNSCAIEVDDFTGFWQLIATVEEGGRSEVRCNARCLTWQPSGDQR